MSSFQFQSSDVIARLKPFGILFEKSLNDLIKGIRAHSKESPESLLTFLDSAIVECKDELSTTDLETKAMAILKLAYLEMYGFEMSWCNFHILEVMSSNKFQQKRIGYLAAIQSFKNEEDLLILATNQFKKDLNSRNHVEIGLALSGIATIVTQNLSKDIHEDVLMKLNHTKPYIRKKAILAMYKIFLQYPESLRANFTRIIDKLDDTDIAVVSATINVICEISKKNPKIFINYLPKFFKILEETKNNWLIIRILKLFQSLSKVEPRMKKKILPSIIDLMTKTQASSLIYECINCIVNGAMLSPDSSKDKETAKLCLEQIMKFFETKDSNLKFVGLLALINTIKIYPSLIRKVHGVSNIIMECLSDNDLIIKHKALDICHYLVTEDNIVDVIKILLVQLIPGEDVVISDSLKLEIVLKIISIGSHDNYSNIPNFKWYIAVLKDMIHLNLLPLKSLSQTPTNAVLSYDTNKVISTEIGKEFKAIITRIPAIRANVLAVVIEMVLNVKVLESCPLLLKDFYWILGEYIGELKVKAEEADNSDSEDESDEEDNNLDDTKTNRILSMGKKIEILNNLVNFKIDKTLEISGEKCNFQIPQKLIDHKEYDILVVAVQALVKLYSSIVDDYVFNYSIDNKIPHSKFIELAYNLNKLIDFLTHWENHSFYEVQERSLSWLEFLKLSLEAMIQGNATELEKLQADEIDYYRNLKDLEKMHNQSDPEASDSSDDSEEDEDEDESEEESNGEYENLSSSEDEQADDDEENNDTTENLLDKPEEGFTNPENDQEATRSSTPPVNELDQLPMLLTHILPSFFKSYPLNPISKNGQKNIGIPEDLDLDSQINAPMIDLISDGEEDVFSDIDEEPEEVKLIDLDKEDDTKQREERMERLKDDPYYIDTSGKKTPKVKKLLIEEPSSSETNSLAADNVTSKPQKKPKKSKKLKKEKVLILSEETIDNQNATVQEEVIKPKKKKNMLKIDSSNLDNFDLNTEISDTNSTKDFEYDVDLSALRTKLASQNEPSNGEKKKKKVKSSKSKDSKEKSKSGSKKKKVDSKVDEAPAPAPVSESVPTKETPQSKEPSKDDSPAPIAIKNTKGKKKKTKAIIQE